MFADFENEIDFSNNPPKYFKIKDFTPPFQMIVNEYVCSALLKNQSYRLLTTKFDLIIN